jgi:hypothetical protein
MRSVESKLSYLLVTIFTPFFVIPAIAQTAGYYVQARLSLAGGKSVYRTGDPIRLVLSFPSDADSYNLNITKQSCLTQACRQRFHVDQEIRK